MPSRGNATQTPASRNPIYDHRFVIVAGKGGVGKSTAAQAIALASAQAGRRTLLFQYAAQKVGTTALDPDRPVGEDIVPLEKHLYAVRPSTPSAMREYVLMKLRSKTAYKLVFENDLVRKMLGGIPGVTELIWLGKAFNHERERRDDGSPAWDTIVLDPPATGHSLYLFQVPFVIRDAVPSGPFHTEAQAMVDLLQDPERTALHLITLPEEMPTNEVILLRNELRKNIRIPIASLIVNSVFPPLFTDEEERDLHALREIVPETGDVIDRLVAAAIFRTERRALQHEYLERLRDELGLPTIELPHYFRQSLDRSVLEDMARRITGFDGVHQSVDMESQPAEQDEPREEAHG